MHLSVVGVNFRNTPVELREKLSFRPADIGGVVAAMHERSASTELLLLSTCNRTELYAAGGDGGTAPERLAELLLGSLDGACRRLEKHLYVHRQRDALAHLISVASGLDSMVAGETEILGQVRHAYEAAQAAGSAGSQISQIMQRVLKVAKRVRTETEIARGRVSVGSIAVDLAEKVFSDLAGRTVMIVGAGKVNEQTLRNLMEKGVGEALVLNRSLARSRALAERHGGTAVPFARLEECLARADIVVSSTAAPHYVIRPEAARRAMASRCRRPLFLIDLAVPRDIDPAVGEIDNVHLHDIDDLQKLGGENLVRRQAAFAHARRIIEEEISEAAGLFRAEELGSVMRRIDAKAERIAEGEMKRAFAKQSVAPLPGACDHCRQEIRTMLHRAMNKMTADSKRALNEAVGGDRWNEFAEIVERLMGIDAGTDDRDTE